MVVSFDDWLLMVWLLWISRGVVLTLWALVLTCLALWRAVREKEDAG